MESTVKQRLVQFIKSMHMTQRAFEIRCGMSNGYVANIRKGIGEDYLLNIAQQFPQLNRAWLLFGEGEMLKTTPTVSGDITVTGNHNSHIGHGQRNMPAIIEIKENGVAVECPNCGEVIEVAETALIPLIPQEVMQKPDVDLGQYIKKNPEKLSMINLAEFFPGATKAVEVDTRAMEPEYKKGHFIVIEKLPDLSYARADGTAYVVDAMRPHSLLRYLTRERDGSYVLTAESDKKRPIYLRADEINGVWKIVGGFWRE